MARASHHSRHTATIDGDFVVFLIGMRINKPSKIHRWWPVFKAMPPMIPSSATILTPAYSA